jgi:hypothetical protein
MAQAVEHLLSKCKVLSSNARTTKKKKQRDVGLWLFFFSHNGFISFYYWVNAGLTEKSYKVVPLLLSLEEILKNYIIFFPQYLVWFTSKTIRAWYILFWKVVIYLIGMSFQITYFSYVSFGTCVF